MENLPGVRSCAVGRGLVVRHCGKSAGISGRELTGQKLEFPTALAGRPAVCVWLQQRGGDQTKAWMNRLDKGGIKAWSIANLEGAPAMIRGMIRGSMRKGLRSRCSNAA